MSRRIPVSLDGGDAAERIPAAESARPVPMMRSFVP